MAFDIIYEPLALKEYINAVLWYKEQSEVAASKFVAEVNDKLLSISLTPFRFKNKFKYFHEVSLKKFPFYIVYFIDAREKKIIITAIYHHKRNPNKKYHRS